MVVSLYLMNEYSGRIHYIAGMLILNKWWFLFSQTIRRVYWCYYADQRAHQAGKLKFLSCVVLVVHLSYEVGLE